MKILKGLGITILVLGVVYLVLALFGPSKMHVERTTLINSSAGTVFNEINTLKQWQMWSYWDNIDPNMKSTYEGPESGVGAKHLWTSTNDSVGNGSLTIKKSEPTSLVECDLEFEGMGVSTSGWSIKDTAGGVLVTAYMDGETPFLFRPMMLFMDMEAILGGDFEKTLAGLKKHCEALGSPEMVAEINIEATTMPVMKVMLINDSCNDQEIEGKLGACYGEIQTEMGKQGLTQSGNVFAIYNKVEERDGGSWYFWMDVGIGVDKPGKSAGRITYKELPGGNVVRGDHYGAYDATPASHEAINKWIEANGKTITGSPWEVYVTDPGTEPDQSKWLTEIYYPVQ